MHLYYFVIILIFFACSNNEQVGKINLNDAQNKFSVKSETNVTPDRGIQIHIDTVMHFEDVNIDLLPPYWKTFTTGKDTTTEWKIMVEDNNHVLAQVSAPHPNYHFNGIYYRPIEIKNGYLEVKFKAVSGKKDQGGGLIWRFQDPDNYYILRANPLENNVVMYKVIKGKRKDLPLIKKGKTYGIKTKPLGKRWHVLAIDFHDNIFIAYLDGKKLFEVHNDAIGMAGQVGLWTKADAVTYFDDFTIKSKSEKE